MARTDHNLHHLSLAELKALKQKGVRCSQEVDKRIRALEAEQKRQRKRKRQRLAAPI